MTRRQRQRWKRRLEALEAELDPLLLEIAEAEAALDALTHVEASLDERRDAHRLVRLAYTAADRVLRAASREAKAVDRAEWSRLRTRHSALTTARQLHLMRERDDDPVPAVGSVQAVDTGMSGPAIGDLLHGRSKEPGSPARYGLDLEAVLRARPAARLVECPARFVLAS
jgi:hypothetical protein